MLRSRGAGNIVNQCNDVPNGPLQNHFRRVVTQSLICFGLCKSLKFNKEWFTLEKFLFHFYFLCRSTLLQNHPSSREGFIISKQSYLCHLVKISLFSYRNVSFFQYRAALVQIYNDICLFIITSFPYQTFSTNNSWNFRQIKSPSLKTSK